MGLRPWPAAVAASPGAGCNAPWSDHDHPQPDPQTARPGGGGPSRACCSPASARWTYRRPIASADDDRAMDRLLEHRQRRAGRHPFKVIVTTTPGDAAACCRRSGVGVAPDAGTAHRCSRRPGAAPAMLPSLSTDPDVVTVSTTRSSGHRQRERRLGHRARTPPTRCAATLGVGRPRPTPARGDRRRHRLRHLQDRGLRQPHRDHARLHGGRGLARGGHRPSIPTATARTWRHDRRRQDRGQGVAPAVSSSACACSTARAGLTSNVISAIQWAVANRRTYGIDVLNLSLGHPIYEPAATDPLVQAVEAAVRAGIVVVVSAGNIGVNPATASWATAASPRRATRRRPSPWARSGRSTPRGAPTTSWPTTARAGRRGTTRYAKPDLVAPGPPRAVGGHHRVHAISTRPTRSARSGLRHPHLHDPERHQHGGARR